MGPGQIGQVSGTVTNGQGIPIQGDPLYWKIGSSGSTVASGSVTSGGSTGYFAIAVNPVPAGTYTLVVSESPTFCGSCGLAQTSATYKSTSTAVYVLTVKLSSKAGVGTGGAVTVSQSGTAVGSCVTDGSASCGVSLSDGTYSVSATYQDYATTSPTPVTISGASKSVALTLSQVLLTGGASFTFTSGGKGVSGVTVVIGNQQKTTGSNGSVAFLVPEGTYSATWTPPSSYGSTEVIPNIVITAGQTYVYTTTLGTFDGVLVFKDASGNPVAGVVVNISALSYRQTTGANGSLSFSGTKGQTYDFTYLPPAGMGSETTGSITLTSTPGTNTETITLTPQSSTGGLSCSLSPSTNTGVWVLVTDSKGNPIANAQVSGGGTSATSDSNGYANLCNFPVPGQNAISNKQASITITASASGYSKGSVSVNVIEGQVSSTTVVLQGGTSLGPLTVWDALIAGGGILAAVGFVMDAREDE